MSSELECVSEAMGRYTCRYAPRPSVCCTNGCCATNADGNAANVALRLWARIVVAVCAGLAMIIIFLLLKYRDRRGDLAYRRLQEYREREAGEREMQRRAAAATPAGADNVQRPPEQDAEVYTFQQQQAQELAPTGRE